MKFKCPACETSFKNSDSRYNIWSCDGCGHEFRGIHCEADMFDYWLHQVPFLPWFYSPDRSYDLQSAKGGPDFTRCPFCHDLVRGFNGKTAYGSWPTVCRSCSSALPTWRHESSPKSSDTENDDSSTPKPDYKKLRELIDRL